MFIERKAFIEYLDSGKIKITTPLRQKEFELKDIQCDQAIDLINLKISQRKKEYKFYALVDNYEDSTSLDVFVNGTQCIGGIASGEQSKLFKSKILEND